MYGTINVENQGSLKQLQWTNELLFGSTDNHWCNGPINYCLGQLIIDGPISLCINFFHLLARKPNLEKFHNFHLSESSFTRPGAWPRGLEQRLSILFQLDF